MPGTKELVALAAAGYAATQTDILGGSAAGQQQQERPGSNVLAPATMAPGLGIAPGLGRSRSQGSAPTNPGMNVTFQAPTVESSDTPQVRYVPQNPTNTGTSPSTDGDKGGNKGKSPNAPTGSSSTSVSTSSGSSANNYDVPEVDMGQDDSGDGNPQTDTGIQAADTPGVQSTEPDQVTQELNMQQGFTRTETTAEMRDDPEHSGGFDVNLGNSSDGQKQGNKGKSPDADTGGGLFSGIESGVDDAVDAGQDFFNDTIGWGDV